MSRMSRMSTAAAAALLGSIVSLAAQGQTVPASVSGVAGTENVKAFIASRIAKGFVPQRTPWGDPDLSGVFTTKDEANTPFERPDEWAGKRMEDITSQEFAEAIVKRHQAALDQAPFFGGGEVEEGVAIAVPIHWFDNLAANNSRPWFVVDPVEGKVPPLTAEARNRPVAVGPGNAAARGLDRETALRGGKRDTYLDRYLGDRCIMWNMGVPHSPSIYGNSFQIVQGKNEIVIRYEMVHEARTIHLDGRPAPAPGVYGYLGYSRGWWDGDSLVVETTNLHPETNYQRFGGGGAPGRNLHFVERFTRIAPGRVEWTLTFDDQTTWERPWTYSVPMTEDNTQLIHEYACHEGNYGMANLLSGGRMADQGLAPK
jgi:hypothetical protein